MDSKIRLINLGNELDKEIKKIPKLQKILDISDSPPYIPQLLIMLLL